MTVTTLASERTPTAATVRPRPTLLREDATRPAALLLREVSKVYDGAVAAVDRVTLDVPRGAFWAVVGGAGAGKSTLVHCASGLDAPTSGQVRIGGTDLARLDEAQRTLLRRRRVGFVFASFNLLPSLTIEEHLSMRARWSRHAPDRRWVLDLARRAGLTHALRAMPGELTAAERQRAAVARAVATRPEVVFADEPAGALDPDQGREVVALLRELAGEFEQTVVLATRDADAARIADVAAVLEAGRIERLVPRPGRLAADLV